MGEKVLSGAAKFKTEKQFVNAANGYFGSISSSDGAKGFEKAPTISGLAVYLGLSLEEWETLKKRYPKATGRAMAVIEAYLEEELVARKTGVTGIMFSLQSNFGWKEKKTEQNEGMEVTIEIV